jgi:sporulation protein YlmC with PRC-barrel domain
MALDVSDIGHAVRGTGDKIVIFGKYNYRFDVPKSKIKQVGRNVILEMEYPELFKYKVDRNTPLPSGESIGKLVDEQ